MPQPFIENPEHKAGRMFKRRIAGFCAAIIATIWFLVVREIIQERQSALERTRSEAINLSAGFEEGVRGILDGVASASRFLKDYIEEKEARGEAIDLAGWKSRISELVGPTIDVFVIDARGELLATTLAHNREHAVFYSDREYYLAHRDNPQLGLLVGHPISGKLEKRTVIPVSRRLNTPDGDFAGVLIFTIDPGLMTALHSKVDLGKTGGLSLFFEDGVIFARYTSQEGFNAPVTGRKIEGTWALRDAQRKSAGSYVKNSGLDGTRRIFAWRKVAGYPLVDVAGLGETEALVGADRKAFIEIGLGMAASALALIMMLVLNHEISRGVQNAIARDEEAEKARQANQVKSAFLANMSHELRTPLNAILGFAEIIRDKAFGRDEDRYRDYAGDIYKAGTHLLTIVSDLLDVSKIEAGKLELREEEVRISRTVHESLAAVARHAEDGGVSVTNGTPHAKAVIMADPTKLKQIIINLLSNAVKFTPKGGAAAIAVTAGADGGLCVTIRDNGIGMSGEEVKEALQLFRQVDNSHSRRFEGTGLGLPLAVRFTELHGGTLTIESVPGLGTEIVVRFPPSRTICAGT